MDAIKNWTFSEDLEEIAPRIQLARQAVRRFRQYFELADAQCTNREKMPRDRRCSRPLIDEQVWTFLEAYGYRHNSALLFEKLTHRPHP